MLYSVLRVIMGGITEFATLSGTPMFLGAMIMGGQPGKLQSPSAFPASTNVGRNDHMMFQSMDNQRSPNPL